MLPEFISPEAPARSQALILALTSVLIATAIHLTLVTLAGSLRVFIENEQQNRLIRRILAVGLVGVAIWLFLAAAR